MASRVVLVTGGTGGIGEAIALGPAAMGARLAITDRGRAPAAAVEIRAASAVLLYRLATYWLPGWLCWRSLQHRGYM
jgi:NAD(P)-dependent dehydrogenase (short-subunit alcohol dehydrogenase family)